MVDFAQTPGFLRSPADQIFSKPIMDYYKDRSHGHIGDRRVHLHFQASVYQPNVNFYLCYYEYSPVDCGTIYYSIHFKGGS